jgi:serine/threonine-protein kinase
MGAFRVGRYWLWRELAVGGMASVHLGRMLGPGGFGKTVAIKRMHPHFAKDPDFVSMFFDEARLTSHLSHPNIVMTLDVLEHDDAVYLVMEYVHGATLSAVQRTLRKTGARVPPALASTIVTGALHGLHAAHTARGDDGAPLHIVHRDVSPQNVLLGVEGAAKLADFGIAKAVGQMHSTGQGTMKGKMAYMAPEQARGEGMTARTDIFAAGILLWEALTGRQLVDGESNAERLGKLLALSPVPPSELVPGLPTGVDSVVLRALATRAEDRWENARAMAIALSEALAPAPAHELGDWLRGIAGQALRERDEMLSEMLRTPAPPTSDPAISVTAPASSPEPVVEASTASEDVRTSTPVAADAAPAMGGASRWPLVLGAVAAMLVAIVGGMLGVMALRRGAARPAAATTAMATATATTTATTTAAATSSATAAATSAASAATSSAAASASASASPPAAAVPRAAARPYVAVPTPKPCKIVTSVDANGHTVFKESCGS